MTWTLGFATGANNVLVVRTAKRLAIAYARRGGRADPGSPWGRGGGTV